MPHLPDCAARRLLMALLILATGVVAGCRESDTSVEQAEEWGTADLSVGVTVTIEGEVEERIGANAFTMGGDETLVLTAAAHGVDDDDVVAVTGEVVELEFPEVEERFGIDLEDTAFVDFENELAVVAESVEVIEEG